MIGLLIGTFEEKEMKVKLTDLHPTQLYLSEKKLQAIQMLDQSAEIINMDPISVLLVDYRRASQGLSGFIGRSGYDFC